MPDITEATVPIQRVTVSTSRPFDDVVAAGSSGLIEFLSLDLGAALAIRDPGTVAGCCGSSLATPSP